MRSAVAVIVAVVVVAAIAAIVAVVGFGFPTRTAATLEGTRLDPQNFAQIARGRYLVAASDCADCHDDPVTKAPFAGGRPIETPFGKVLAANITPDRDTAIGAWSDSAFVAALREGKSPHGSPLYPAMPYPYYTKLSESDALAIRAYLNTVPPVRNRVVADQLPFPLNIRQAMLLWNAVYFHPGEFKPDPSQSAEWNRGAYLVEGPGHCGACHTPKNVLGGDDNGRALRGYQLQGWFAPNITGDPVDGVGRWSADDIASYLKTGHTVTTAATGIMAEVVAFTGSKLTDSDLRAIAIYLKSLPGQSQPGPALGASNIEDESWRGDLPRRMLGVPQPGRQGRRLPVSRAGGFRQRALGESDEPHPHRVAGRAQRRDRQGAHGRRHARLRLEARRQEDRRGPHLRPQQLGRGGGAGDGRGRPQAPLLPYEQRRTITKRLRDRPPISGQNSYCVPTDSMPSLLRPSPAPISVPADTRVDGRWRSPSFGF